MASLACMVAVACLTATPHPPAHRIVVASDGRVSTISAALRQARAGDTVVVTAGVYREPRLEIRVPLVILGEGLAVLDAGGAHEALTVRADDVTIRGLTIRNVSPSFVEDRAGIRLDGVRGCRVEGNHLIDTFFGIYAARASDCTIAGNLIEGRARRQTEAGNAIHLFSSTGFTVTGNRVRGHRDGIYLEFSPHTTIADNESRENLRYGLHFMFSDTCEYRHNVFRRNTSGVAVMYSHRVVMTGNRFEDSWGAASYGLLLKEIKDGRIEGNWIAGNTVGIFAESADRMVVTDNQFVRNGWALRLMADATDGEFRHNRFAGNTFDVATNSQSSSPNTFEANYWDGYQGYDLNRDGIGDVPYRPVRLASVLVASNEPTLILLRSFFLDLLEVAERVMPVLTPDALVDRRPLMRWGSS
ncbi:MAG TPA: nitrous oxide reductase family maturation protein NosD [Gemmatimonadales bacterium]|nr:nitrous oxide reductase family maturation protein NosD [Gemmatimonadales bacterium]